MQNLTFTRRIPFALTLTTVLLTVLGLTPFAFAEDVCPSGCDFSTIQAAVDAVDAGSRITIKPGTYVENVYVDKELEFYGDDSDPSVTVVDGGAAGPVFVVEGTVGSEVEFTRLTITNGQSEKGGGIKSRHSTVKVVECILLDNLATSRGGGIFSKNGSLTVSKSTLESNQADGLTDASGGGIFVRNGDARIEHSLLLENAAGDGGGGGLGNRGGEVTLDNTTVTANYSVAGTGGGIDNRVGGDLRVTFSTVFGNAAVDGTGGGIHNAADSTAEIENTILARNSANDSPECGGVLTSLDHNLMMGLGCTFVPLPGDILLTDPLLAALADNGGPTRTFALLPGSPAIDAIANGNPRCGLLDQRFEPRPKDGDADGMQACDIGAFEVQ